MKNIVAISGSASRNSSNTQLLQAMNVTFSDDYSIEVVGELWRLPLYTPQLEQNGIPVAVQQLRTQLNAADAVIVCTPEYVHNIPAVLKNMIEWVTTSGELSEKPVLPITFTPAAPRGEYAMISLVQSLKACNAKVVTKLPLHSNELRMEDGILGLDKTHSALLSEALGLL